MRKSRGLNFRLEEVVPYEHLKFCVENTSPLQRWKWLEKAWIFWRSLQKKRVVKRIYE
jgi:hypothetical protein